MVVVLILANVVELADVKGPSAAAPRLRSFWRDFLGFSQFVRLILLLLLGWLSLGMFFCASFVYKYQLIVYETCEKRRDDETEVDHGKLGPAGLGMCQPHVAVRYPWVRDVF